VAGSHPGQLRDDLIYSVLLRSTSAQYLTVPLFSTWHGQPDVSLPSVPPDESHSLPLRQSAPLSQLRRPQAAFSLFPTYRSLPHHFTFPLLPADRSSIDPSAALVLFPPQAVQCRIFPPLTPQRPIATLLLFNYFPKRRQYIISPSRLHPIA